MNTDRALNEKNRPKGRFLPMLPVPNSRANKFWYNLQQGTHYTLIYSDKSRSFDSNYSLELMNIQQVVPKKVLVDMHVSKKQPIKHIADTLETTSKTIRYHLDKHQIDIQEIENLGKGQIPYGLMLRNGVFIENKYEQQIISMMKNFIEDGHSIGYITRYLNDNEIPTKNNRKWHRNTVSKIISTHS